MKEVNDIVASYQTANDDAKMDILSGIIDDLDLSTYKFLLGELHNDDLDEFVAIEIIKAISLYSPKSKSEKTIQALFSIVENSDDDLVKIYALRGLGYFTLTENYYNSIKEIMESSSNDDLRATAREVLSGASS